MLVEKSARAYTEGDLRAAAVALAQHEAADGPFTDAERNEFLDGWLREPYVGDPEPVSVARMVAEFNEHPNSSSRSHTRLLVDTLLREEATELSIELDLDGPVSVSSIARECADVVYVVYTIAWAWGIDLNAALREVHRAAMDKVEANVRRPEDGKIVKPPGFRPPDMTEAVRRAA